MCNNCIEEICQQRCIPVVPEKECSPYYQGQACNDGDEDLLIGREMECLTIGPWSVPAPSQGWTHELIHRYCVCYEKQAGGSSGEVNIGGVRVGGVDHSNSNKGSGA